MHPVTAGPPDDDIADTPPQRLTVDFAGEIHHPVPGVPFVIGRSGDLEIDDNPYLHRRLLVLTSGAGLWWLHNAGERIAATLRDADSRMETWLAPGARVPIVFARTFVAFSAGSTSYEVELIVEQAAYAPLPDLAAADVDGTTLGAASITDQERLVLLALCERSLRRRARGLAEVPSLARVAERLGWPGSRLNRALDHLCEKLTRHGVPGLVGGRERLAVDRRARLVEYAIAARLVVAEDLDLLETAG